MSPYAEIFRRLSQPLDPLPTHVEPRLAKLPGIRAVLLDVYGTLIISGTGDIGVARESHLGDALAATCDSLGLELPCPPTMAAEEFLAAIARDHDRARAEGIEFPEMNIIEVWRGVCKKLAIKGANPSQLAVEFEARANPTWPMPGLESCLASLRQRGCVLGLISNAQFFTPELFPALVGKTLDELGFDPELRYYSYEQYHAKPDERMYRIASRTLESRKIDPSAAIYVGNDMRNDITPAAKVGFRTALFAGDARSLRLREDDPFVAGVEPDVIITELNQLLEIV